MANVEKEAPKDSSKKLFSWLSNLKNLLWALGSIFAPLLSQDARQALSGFWRMPYAKTIAAYYVAVLLGFALWSANEMYKLKVKLRAKIEAGPEEEASVALPNYINEYLQSVREDSAHCHYPYTYDLVEHSAHIDKNGNYAATYTHIFKNDSTKIIVDYKFDLRTTQRAYFHQLNATATSAVDKGLTAVARVKCSMQSAESHLPVTIKLPAPVAIGATCTISLKFTWPHAIQMDGQDGDVLDLTRFESVREASLALTFDDPPFQGVWSWQKDGKMEHYPHQPTPASPTSHVLKLPFPNGDTLERTIYIFTGTS